MLPGTQEKPDVQDPMPEHGEELSVGPYQKQGL